MNDNAIRRIQVGDLRKMSDREGLILQGCGGDPQEWLDGINEMLADAGILRNGSRFERASLFEYDGHTNMLFDFEGVDLQIVFNRDILVNESEAIENCSKSVGILSDETIVEQHPWTSDVEAELARLKKEKEKALEQAQEYSGAFGTGGNQNKEPGGDE